MKLELRKEYSPTFREFAYRIYKDDIFVDTSKDLERAKQLYEGYEKEFSTPPEIILSKEIIRNKKTTGFRCEDCGWVGEELELINPNGFGEGGYVEGECCPKCESNKIEEVNNEEI